MDLETARKISILQDLVRIESVNDHEAAVASYLATLFDPYRDRVTIERVPYAADRDNLVVTMGNPAGRHLGISGHMDVVDPGDLAAWTHHPFGGEVVDDRLYGRGTSDMKSGLAAMVIAMLELLEEDVALPGTIRLLATVGEETGEYGAAQLTDKGYADDLDGLVIAEPSGMDKVTYTSRGVIDYHVDSIGKSAHSARPDKGINAIDNLMTYYNEVNDLIARFDRKDPVLGGLLHSVDLISGGEQINSIPAKARLSANMRTIPAYPNQMIYKALEDLIHRLNQRPGFHLSITYSYPEEAVPGRPDAPLVRLVQKVGHRVMGKRIIPVGSGGANDGSEFSRAKGNFMSVVIGPGSDTAHEPDEYISITQYLQSVEFYKEFAVAFLNERK